MIQSRRQFIGTAAGVSAVALVAAGKVLPSREDADLTQFVDISIGTGGFGHTFPAATVPFGAVQLGPDTGHHGWDHCSGYRFEDTRILGFSHTHLSGTGVGDMLDFRMMPGFVNASGKPVTPADFAAPFSHAAEHKEPGFYSVELSDSGIRVELTATERAGMHRYTFPKNGGCLLLDLEPVWTIDPPRPDEPIRVLSASIRLERDTLFASRSTAAWAVGRQIHCAMKFSRPVTRIDLYQDGNLLDPSAGELSGKRLMCVLHFDHAADNVLEVKAGISGVSTEGAGRNLQAEMPQWSFDALRRAAKARWQTELSRVVVTSDDLRGKRIFYTGLYHSLLAPTLFDDVNGQYMGMDGEVHTLSPGRHNYSTFSFWDTYRALHPMYTLLLPERVPDIVSCIVRQSTESAAGVTIWPLQGKETFCMVGYHSAPVVAEALVKGFKGIDAKAAYAVYHKRAAGDDYQGLAAYRRYGYVPCDVEDASASKTCDYAYDDWCVAAIAHAAGETEEAARLRQQSRSYRNLYDHESGFIRPRYADGHWAAPFNPKSITVTKWRDYTESNAWETTFLVQHDGPGLAQLMGGKAALENKLDALFNESSDLPADMPPDMTGMVGQYCQGNEPCHHIAHFYNVAGVPHKTQHRIHQLMTELYDDRPDGMAGNEDCGQMSAWYCMNALGLYPVDPVSGEYDIGTPLFDRVVLSVGEGKKLTVEAHRESPSSIYVASVMLNGQPQLNWKLEHSALRLGGRLTFKLVDHPVFGKSVG